MGDIEDVLMNAVTKTALTRCSVTGDHANVSVFFSQKETQELEQGGVMISVPKRMEALIREESGKDLFLPEFFFENMEYEDVDGGRVYSYEGKVFDQERDNGPIYEAMDEMGVARPIEE
jgi:hypothetical protein